MTTHELVRGAAPGPFDGGVAGIVEKGLHLLDYVAHRTAMLVRFHAARIGHRLRFAGRVRSILVIRLASIGDIVRATAVLGRLKVEYPGAQIDFLTTASGVPLLRSHPALRSVYTVEQLRSLQDYDWIINLQTTDPPEGFLRAHGTAHRDVLEYVSARVRASWRSGRRMASQRERRSTNATYCRSEMEELFLIALLRFDPARYPATHIHVSPDIRAAVMRKFPLPGSRPVIGVFLGSNSIGCGADEGWRTYSMDYLERIVRHFAGRFTIAVVGQSQARNAGERAQYQDLLRRHPEVVDLVDRTSLEELAAIMDRFALVVSSDSSPVHIALARGVPVVGLYVHDASFRMSPRLAQDAFVALNSRPPCFYYSWRWRFFCATCRDSGTRASYCREPIPAFAVDGIPIREIERAGDRLLRSHHANAGPVPASLYLERVQ